MRFEFKPQDVWIGAFWERKRFPFGGHITDVWVCFLPMVPLHVRRVNR